MKKNILWISICLFIIISGVGIGIFFYNLSNDLSYDSLLEDFNSRYGVDLSIMVSDSEISLEGYFDPGSKTLTFSDVDENDYQISGNIYQEILSLLQNEKLKKNAIITKSVTFSALPIFNNLLQSIPFLLDFDSSSCEFSLNDEFLDSMYCQNDNQNIMISFLSNDYV